MLKVTVGHGALGVIRGHQEALDGLRERLSPDIALTVSVEVDSTHAWLCGVGGS